jgi:hypothetical protein
LLYEGDSAGRRYNSTSHTGPQSYQKTKLALEFCLSAFFFGGEMKHVGDYIIRSRPGDRYLFVTSGHNFGATWPRRVMSDGAGSVKTPKKPFFERFRPKKHQIREARKKFVKPRRFVNAACRPVTGYGLVVTKVVRARACACMMQGIAKRGVSALKVEVMLRTHPASSCCAFPAFSLNLLSAGSAREGAGFEISDLRSEMASCLCGAGRVWHDVRDAGGA